MCGFCCYFYLEYSENGYHNLDIDLALQNIYHRGPDSSGKYISPNGRCVLGHTRLSIIDLEGGQQPLSNKNETIHSVVNGELYDFERIRDELTKQGHEFKTLSDSEIALHLYEEYDLSMFDSLRGEFAICIYDTKKNRFIAARDRYGIKPLYYTIYNGALFVASEIKAFLPLGWKAEWDIESIVNNGPYLNQKTCFKGVRKLPPGHYLITDSVGSIDVVQYWDADYPDKTIEDTRSVEEMILGVRERLVESIRHRLRADVPVGIYLSGGLDSSSICGIASTLLREKNSDAKIRAFSISFKDSGKFDEGPIAERTAAHCNAEFSKISLTEEDLLENLEESVWYGEQPQVNLNGVGKFLLSKHVRDSGYRVVLTGEGSDEHFAGYPMFQNDFVREPDFASPNGFGTIPEEKRQEYIEKYGEQSFYENFVGKMKPIDPQKYTAARKMVNNANTHVHLGNIVSLPEEYFSHDILKITGSPNHPLVMAENMNGVQRSKAMKKWHPLHTGLYLENRTFLANYLCNMLGDRSEMAHSVEARTPFLDHHLCEYVNNLPPSVKICVQEDGSLKEKWILNEATKPYITDEIYNRKKHPFLAPTSKGRSQAIIDLCDKLLNKEKLENLGWANVDKILEVKNEFLKDGTPILFRDILIMMGYVTLSDRFNIAQFGGSLIVSR